MRYADLPRTPEAQQAVASSNQYIVRPLTGSELADAVRLTHEKLAAPVANLAIVERIHRHNKDSFWGLFQKKSPDSAELAGYMGMLFLNEIGVKAVESGLLNTSNPLLEHLADGSKGPAAIYLWCIVAPKRGKLAIDMISRAMGAQYAGLTLYAGAASESGLRAIQGFGFKPLTPEKSGIGGVFILERSAGRSGEPKPHRDNPWEGRLRVDVATSSDDVEKALAIRAAVFLVEQNCPYAEEFDGNDRSAMHLVGYVDGEPAGTLRLRFFADFAKPERLAVLPRFRGTLLAKELVDTAFNICRRKGYRTLYGHAEQHVEKFWARFGFKPMTKNYRLTFSDHEFVEMQADVDPHPDPLTVHSNPYLLVRPEGSWDAPGILDQSAARPATNPH
jgi:predicted GNAT family N-acyltransferase